MPSPLFIDSEQIDWIEPPPPKFNNTVLKPLYDKESGMLERVYYIRIRPSGSIAPHTHEATETFFIINGEGVVSIEDVETTEIKGKVFFAPAGAAHGLKNTGSEDIVLISFSQH